MASSPEILKRKRSRPSEWWAAAPSTALTQQEHLPQQQRVPAERKTQDVKRAQATVPEGLKRKRSRPSEWWAAVPSPDPVQPEQLQQKQRVLSERKIQEGSAAGNRWESKGKGADDTHASDNEKENREIMKQGRKGHLDNAQFELQTISTTHPALQTVSKRHGRPQIGNMEAIGGAGKVEEHRAEQSKRGRPSTKDEKKNKTGIRVMDSDELASAVERAVMHCPPSKESSFKRPEKSRRVDGANDFAGESIRRGRSSNIEAEVQAISHAATKIQRRSKKDANPGNTQPTSKSFIPSTQDESPRGRRTRHSDLARGEIVVENLNNDPVRPSTRGRHSGHILAVEKASSAFTKDRPRGKKHEGARYIADPNATKPATTDILKTRKAVKSGARPTQGSSFRAKGKSSKQEASVKGAAQNRKKIKGPKDDLRAEKHRRGERLREVDENEVSQPERIPDYQHLTAVSRRVSRQTIETQWEPLLPGCIELISQFLSDLQRPVIVRLNDERQRTQASTALQMVIRRLVSKISKGLPFPGIHGSQEDNFDFEKILDRNRAFEAQLTPALHANELLEVELKKEAALLESEQAILARLETNAKTESALRKQAGLKLHPLLQSENSANEVPAMTDRIGLGNSHDYRPVTLDFHLDENLQAVFAQFNGHADSIQGNMNQIQGIAEAMSKSKGAVQAMLFDHLDPTQYEGVVLG